MASTFVEQVLNEDLDCRYQHQVEYILSEQSVFHPDRLGSDLSPDVFNYFSKSFDQSTVEFGFKYDSGSLTESGIFPLPQVCEPWSVNLVGLDRPLIKVPIEEDLRLVGAISARIKLIAQSEEAIDFSMEVLINKSGQGWVGLGDKYNMHRSRKRVFGKKSKLVNVDMSTPFLSLELKKGDSLIISFQSSHNAVSLCSEADLQWIMSQGHDLEVFFHFVRM